MIMIISNLRQAEYWFYSLLEEHLYNNYAIIIVVYCTCVGCSAWTRKSSHFSNMASFPVPKI